MKMRASRVVVSLALAIAGVLSVFPTAAQAVPTNAEWIRSLVLPDGAIARDIQPWMNGYPRYVAPYWANMSAYGLARTGDPVDLQVVWNWLSWYQAHMSPAGHVRNEQLVWDLTASPPTYTYDPDPMNEWFSTVGNAGTFLIALREVYVNSGSDTAKLAEYLTGIQKAIAAINATMDVDGLAWQNPRVKVKLLMDQAEAYAGLRRGATLANALGDSVTAKLAGSLADKIDAGIETLYNAAAKMYAKAKNEDGSLEATTWNQYYMDSTAQVWTVGFGNIPPAKPLMPSTRAKSIVDTFATKWPEWSDPYFTVPPADPRVPGTSDGAIHFWPMVGLAFSDVGRKAEGLAGVNAIEAAALGAERTWPFTVGHAGEIIRVRGS